MGCCRLEIKEKVDRGSVTSGGMPEGRIRRA